jgi:cytochrome c oxidase assembly protein subunit 15
LIVNETSYQPGLHRVAMLTTAATFPLIFMGGLVTSHQAGMSVPDWPNSYGYNMFLFPPSQWDGGIFYEHTHRLMGTVVGMLSILLAVWAWRTEPRKWFLWLAYSVLGAVIFQGVLGGLRVVLVELDLAIVHACFAQAFFCLAALMVAATSRWWVGTQLAKGFEVLPGKTPALPVSSLVEDQREGVCPCSDRTARLAILAVLTIYLQLVAGAVMRHYQAGLAIPDLPLAYGQLLPPATAAGLEAVNQWRGWHPELDLDRVTLAQVWIHFAHRVGAVLVTLAVASLVVRILRRRREDLLLVRPALFLIALIATQLTLGVLTVLKQKPADLATLHVAVGALTLVTAFTIAVRAMRLNRITEATPARKASSSHRAEQFTFDSAVTA